MICICPEKQSLPWNVSLHWIYLLPFRIFEQFCACADKQSLPWSFSLSWIFLHSGFSSNLRLHWKTVCPEFTVLNIFFYHSGFLSNLRLPWKIELPGIFSLYYVIFFIIQDFEQRCACPTKQSLHWHFSLYCIFLHSGFLSNLRLLRKNVCPEFTVLNT